MDDLEIGSAPHDEDCASLGLTPDYARLARIECQLYIAVLIAASGTPPPGARYHIVEHAHDFGIYPEVAIRFDPHSTAAVSYARRAAEGSATWAPFTAPMNHSTPRAPIIHHHSANSAIVATIIDLGRHEHPIIELQRARLRLAYPYAAAAADTVLASRGQAA